MKKTSIFIVGFFILLFPVIASAHEVDFNRSGDADHDGLTDEEEIKYGTNVNNPDTDADNYKDGDEVYHGYDPLVPGSARLPKRIDINLSQQTLRFYYGEYGEQGNFLISSGKKGFRTPARNFDIKKKIPAVTYKGIDNGQKYNYPNTKWNLSLGNGYYIHGAYWHNNFGYPMSHGCVNVSYSNMEGLYNFADVGTKVTIHY